MPNQIDRYYLRHTLGAAFPLAAGFWLFGWQAIQIVAVLLAATMLGTLLWRRIGARGPALRWGHVVWLALLLALMLPPHLMLDLPRQDPTLWAIVPAAGLLLVILIWAQGGIGSMPLHPLLLTYLLLAALYGEALTPHLVLHRSRTFTGDLADVDPNAAEDLLLQEPWFSLPGTAKHDAVWLGQPAPARLTQYTRSWPRQRAPMPMEAMLRDHMPPLENLVVGGHPGAIGTGSAIAVLIGGLFLLHRGLIDYRVPLLIVLVSFGLFAALPPLLMPGARLDWASAIVFAGYETVASPLLFMAFFLATNTAICPVGRRARAAFALLTGALAAACQLYISAAHGPYIALALAGLASRRIDHRLAGCRAMPH